MTAKWSSIFFSQVDGSFLNLCALSSGDIGGHYSRIAADKYTLVDSTLIPARELADVMVTPFDFRKGFAIGILNKHSLTTAVADVIGNKSSTIP